MGGQNNKHEMRHHRGSIPVCLSLSLFFGLGLLLVFSSPSQEQHRVGPGVENQLPTEEEAQADDAVASTLAGWCPYGSLAGYWDAGASFPDSRWHVMHPTCVLHSMVEPLVSYTSGLHMPPSNGSQAALTDAGSTTTPNGSVKSDTAAEAGAGRSQDTGQGLKLPPLQLPPRLTEVTKELDRLANMAHAALPEAMAPAGTSSSSKSTAASGAQENASGAAGAAVNNKDETAAGATAAPAAGASQAELESALSARMLFLSDSVDRYILTYLCNVVEGEALMMNLDGTPRVENPPPADPNPPVTPSPEPPTMPPSPLPSTPTSIPAPITANTTSSATDSAPMTSQQQQEQQQSHQGHEQQQQLQQQDAEQGHEGVAEEGQADVHAGTETRHGQGADSARIPTMAGATSQVVTKPKETAQQPDMAAVDGTASGGLTGNTFAGQGGATTVASANAEAAGSSTNSGATVHSGNTQEAVDAAAKAAVSSATGTVDVGTSGRQNVHVSSTGQGVGTANAPTTQASGSELAVDAGKTAHQHQLNLQHRHHAHQHHQHHTHHQSAQQQSVQQQQQAPNGAASDMQKSSSITQPVRKLLAQRPTPQFAQQVVVNGDQQHAGWEDDPQVVHAQQQQDDPGDVLDGQQQPYVEGQTDLGSLVLLSIKQSLQSLMAGAGRALRLMGPGQQGPSGGLLYQHNTGIRTAQQVQARSTLPAAATTPEDGGLGSGVLADGEALSWHSHMSSQSYVTGAEARASRMPGPVKRYLPTVCSATQVPGLKLMSTYIPGVHPTGPYHRGVRRGWQQQVVDAARLWDAWKSAGQQAGKQEPPYIVVLSSCLWDLARLHAYEPEQVSGTELPPALLEAWAANFTHVVKGVRAALPQASMLVYHTTMMPRFDPHTGVLEKRHLGRRLYISQLNAAGKQVAASLGLEVVDYSALANRFMEGQSYLADDIHPGPGVGLEAANILLNYVHQVQLRQAQNPDWQHPSMWLDRPQHHQHHLLQGSTPPPARSMHTRPKRTPQEPAKEVDNTQPRQQA